MKVVQRLCPAFCTQSTSTIVQVIYRLINASNCFLIAVPPDLLLPPRNWSPPQGQWRSLRSRGQTQAHSHTHAQRATPLIPECQAKGIQRPAVLSA